jgi:hypothetical protein
VCIFVALGYGYIGGRTDTTQQSGQTSDKEVEIKNITVYVSGYTETDTTGVLSPTNVWLFRVAVDINSNVFDFHFFIWSLSRLLCCVGSGFNVAAALDVQHARRMRQIIICGPPRSTKIFHLFLINGTIFEKSHRTQNVCFEFSLQLLSETFLILRRTERDMIKMYIGLYVK